MWWKVDFLKWKGGSWETRAESVCTREMGARSIQWDRYQQLEEIWDILKIWKKNAVKIKQWKKKKNYGGKILITEIQEEDVRIIKENELRQNSPPFFLR